MKKLLMLTVIIAAAMLLMPLSSVSGTKPKEDKTAVQTNATPIETTAKVTDTFRLYDHKTKKITEISREDYIFGVVAAEMPASYEVEALKAQAVAAYTYACFYREQNKDEKYDLSTDYTVSQCYITKAEAKEKWGSRAQEYAEKIESAVKAVGNRRIEYNDDIILAVYHAISAGKTESCANVWGRDYPYLKAVDSSFDKEAQNYSVKTEFEEDELKEKLGDEIKWTGKPENYFGKATFTDSGYVKEIVVCDKKIDGTDIRSRLDLRSSCFEVEYKNDKFVFTTYGYGHGVGMSQNGANALAKQGKSYEEILLHYYSSCSLSQG